MSHLRIRRRAFTLLEIFVVLGIIAMFLALLVPFFLRMREGGRSEECVRNMQRIGKAILQYSKDNEDRLPGPLDTDQYPVASAGTPPRTGQLLKHIATYLNAPAGSPDAGATAKTTFTFPAWQKNSERTTDAPVFIINNDPVTPFGQPAWGAEGRQPLKQAQLSEWRRVNGEKQEIVEPSKMWALTEADQVLAQLLSINAPWVQRTPQKAVHTTHRTALYFDWHVEPLSLTKSSEAVPLK